MIETTVTVRSKLLWPNLSAWSAILRSSRFEVIKVLDTGPITNHVNFARNSRGQFAYVTVGGLNVVKVFRTEDFEQVAAIETGALPHGLWPSGDGTRIYVGLENADAAAAIDTLENKVIATIPVGLTVASDRTE